MKDKPKAIARVLPLAMGLLSLALAVASFLLLPDTVVTQLSLGGSGVSSMPKAFAVALPTLLGVGGAAVSLFSKGDPAAKSKGLIASAVGVAVFAIMLVVNLI